MVIKETQNKGRGVFAEKDYKKGELIEICPVVVLSAKQRQLIDKTELFNYYFGWEDGQAGIVLGYGMMYNHSFRPNAEYSKNFLDRTVAVLAHQNIKSNSEITVNYNGKPKSQAKIWFNTKE
ncbi:SET domain-containing protein-lysine N-methyltransferase [Candidatus Saccharibacteria bacterium]|nr:SET domain-containing protein-lysine N-methyltransferase [Candidatus Saccharibacteria bacterium]